MGRSHLQVVVLASLLVTAAAGVASAPPRGSLTLLAPAAEGVRKKSPGGFERLKRTRGKVADTAILLDDKDEENLDCFGISKRAVWLAIIWALPVTLAPFATMSQNFRTAVWYRILAMALAKSGKRQTEWCQAYNVQLPKHTFPGSY